MKIRIFALAKELDIDSKLLIDYCAKAGITIKNSALASISPEEKDRVLGVMRSATAGSAPATTAVAAAAPAKASPVMASREPAADVALKPRPIRVMGAKPPLMVPRSRLGDGEPPKHEVPAPVEQDELPVVKPVELVEPDVVENVAAAPEEVVSPSPAPVEVVEATPIVATTAVKTVEKPVAAATVVPPAPVSRGTTSPKSPESKSSDEDRGGPSRRSDPISQHLRCRSDRCVRWSLAGPPTWVGQKPGRRSRRLSPLDH